jgi:hypothetical protein
VVARAFVGCGLATANSLDAGYTGLRMIANGTMRVVDSRRRARFIR